MREKYDHELVIGIFDELLGKEKKSITKRYQPLGFVYFIKKLRLNKYLDRVSHSEKQDLEQGDFMMGKGILC
jgi:hypothetical protein